MWTLLTPVSSAPSPLVYVFSQGPASNSSQKTPLFHSLAGWGVGGGFFWITGLKRAHPHLFQAGNSQAFSNTHPEGPHEYHWSQLIQDGNMLSHLFCVYLMVVLRLFFWQSMGPGCYLRQQTSRVQRPENT